MLFRQNAAVPAVPHNINWLFRHLFLLWRNEVPTTGLKEAEPWLEPQPLTAQLSPIATELWSAGEGLSVCPGAKPENLCDCGHVHSRTILFPGWCLVFRLQGLVGCIPFRGGFPRSQNVNNSSMLVVFPCW